jgi:nuclear pore complex protein Nup98-Nup96
VFAPKQISTVFFIGVTGTGLFTPGQTAFGVKPAGQTFGAVTSTPSNLGFGQTTMFGGASAANAKPSPFGGTTFGSSGFGTTPSFGTATGGMGTGAPGSLFGNTSIGAPSTSMSFGTTQPTTGTSSSQLPIHQYILTLSEISQSSDHPLFRKMLEPSGKPLRMNTVERISFINCFIAFSGKTEELIKSSARTSLSNGAAPTPPQYRISPLPSNKIRTKALLNGSSTGGGRRSIFEGLSDEEEGEENGAGSEAKTDFFVPRRSVKKLQLKAISLDTTVDTDNKPDDDAEPIKSAPLITPSEERPVVLDSRPDLRVREELDDSLTVLKIRRPTVAFLNQSAMLERSSMLDETGLGEGEVTVAEEISETVEEEIVPPHPAGIVLRRCGYSTMPTMEDLAIKGLDENGKCIITSFSIIRQGYGRIFFEGPLDVANLNLDEIG